MTLSLPPAGIFLFGSRAILAALAAILEEETGFNPKSARPRCAHRLGVAHFVRTLGFTSTEQHWPAGRQTDGGCAREAAKDMSFHHMLAVNMVPGTAAAAAAPTATVLFSFSGPLLLAWLIRSGMGAFGQMR